MCTSQRGFARLSSFRSSVGGRVLSFIRIAKRISYASAELPVAPKVTPEETPEVVRRRNFGHLLQIPSSNRWFLIRNQSLLWLKYLFICILHNYLFHLLFRRQFNNPCRGDNNSSQSSEIARLFDLLHHKTGDFIVVGRLAPRTRDRNNFLGYEDKDMRQFITVHAMDSSVYHWK